MRLSAWVLISALTLSIACGRASPDPRASRVDASWSGTDSGRIVARASSEWCAERRLLEIRAIQGDTALAMVLYMVDSIEPDTYRVVQPEAADTSRPTAAVALRVFSSNTVQGYQADSGSVVLDRSRSGTLSGSVETRARSVVNGQLLRISGRARDLVVVPQHRGCSPDSTRTQNSTRDSIGARPASPGAD